MGDIDQVVKSLLQLRIMEIAPTIVPGLTDIEPMSAETPVPPQRLADSVYTATIDGVRCLVNVEIQLHGDESMGKRLSEYGARLYSIYNLPVISIVLWLENVGTFPTTPHQMTAGRYQLMTWPFFSLKIFELDAKEALALGPIGLLPLISFMRDTDEAIVEAAGRRIVNQVPAHDEMNDLESILALLASRRFGKDFGTILLQRITNMSTTFVENFPLYWQFHDQGEAIGEVRGEAQGLRESFSLIWQARFGPLPEDVAASLDVAEIAHLKSLITYAVTETQEQLRTLLGLT